MIESPGGSDYPFDVIKPGSPGNSINGFVVSFIGKDLMNRKQITALKKKLCSL